MLLHIAYSEMTMESVFMFGSAAALVLLVATVVWTVGNKKRSLALIPYVDWEGENALSSKQRFFGDARGILLEAYRKIGDSAYKLRTPEGDRIFISRSAAEALKSMPRKFFNFQEASNEFLAANYLTIDWAPEWSYTAVRMDLTQSLARLMPALNDEMRHCLKTEIPPCDDWTPIAMFPRLLRIVALLSGRIFVGPALNRNEAWITSAINFTTDVFEGGRKIKMWHPLLRPIAQYFIPEIRKIHAHHRRVYKLLLPTLKARAEAERKPGYQKPDDLIQWLMDRATAWEELDFKVQASTLLVISLAAIHTSTMAVTHAVYDLAARPEYLEPLREEITQVLAAEGGFTKRAMMRMRKLDSFLKESQRHSPFALIGFLQKVVHPITLPSGPLLPAGTIFCVPNSVLDREAGIWSDPHAFDGFRYSTLRDSSPDEGRKHAFSEVSQDSMHFGYGGHTCPGRFFATNEIKLIIAHLVLGFDLGLREKGVRPRNVEFALQVLPDPTVEVLMRRRG